MQKDVGNLRFMTRSNNLSQIGSIRGWLEIRICLQEAVDFLYNPRKLRECPTRPPAELDIATFQAHIVRAKAIIDEVTAVVDSYRYVVSWKDPFLSAVTLLFLVVVCIGFDAEYFGWCVERGHVN